MIDSKHWLEGPLQMDSPSLLSVKLKGGSRGGQLREFEYHCHGCIVFSFARKVFFRFHLPVDVCSFSQCVHLLRTKHNLKCMRRLVLVQ